ncbi:MAG: hypothetical protein JKY65_27875 [Planctomycetes bacterium]|nr:hypothetical protein [Planctomycetota bacterium]
MTKQDPEVTPLLEAIIEEAFVLSSDLGAEVSRVLKEGQAAPLAESETRALLTQIVRKLQEEARANEDKATLDSLDGEPEAIAATMIAQTRRGQPRDARDPHVTFPLHEHDGIKPAVVVPMPVYHGIKVPMTCGYVKTRSVHLWDRNERLEIHLNQFRSREDREPTPDELLDIMLSRLDLPGLAGTADQFAIEKLARSIVANGVQRPPILDVDGTLLDGNRRVTACQFILNSAEFTSEEKRRAEWVYVWQLIPHARLDHQREAVVVALNFEDDCKEDWPEYVKARKVYDAWGAMLEIEPRKPSSRRQASMKRELSKKFALGPDTNTVNRYLKMVSWADDFEEHHINTRGRDQYEVKHRSNRYFQYFDEMAKGAKPGGVAYGLTQDDAFRQIVFDLLFDGKFKTWRDIRQLKEIRDNPEAREALIRARDETDEEEADNHLKDAMAIARARRADAREVGANTRIESFTSWLDELPTRAYRDSIKPEKLRGLLKALRTAEANASAVLEDGEVEFCGKCGRPRR